jgi:hypothetical protein
VEKRKNKMKNFVSRLHAKTDKELLEKIDSLNSFVYGVNRVKPLSASDRSVRMLECAETIAIKRNLTK